MTLDLVASVRNDHDRFVLNQLNDWCMKNRINLVTGENPGYVSLHFSGNDMVIMALAQHLSRIRLFQQR